MSTLVAVPMHGEVKLRTEGLRTRDAHLLEWFGRLRPTMSLAVHSRPEPWPRVSLARRHGTSLPATWRMTSPQPLTVPVLRNRRRWWVSSLRYDVAWPEADAGIIWNPISGASRHRLSSRPPRTALDLLDDWSAHTAFDTIADDVHRAYEYLFSVCEVVTANSEATGALAERFGRSDVQVIRNGCDPDRFSAAVTPHEKFTVGYGGKIGHRLDVDLVIAAARRFPKWRFEFVGQILVSRVRRQLDRLPNVSFSGDVRYEDYPRCFAAWDLAWVPHRLGVGEVGGDVIKLYEYRAAGLSVVSTRIIGWERALPGVVAAERDDVIAALAERAGSEQPGSVARDRYVTPTEDTWSAKAARILDLLSL